MISCLSFFYSDETKFEAIAKGGSTIDTISFSDLMQFFYALHKLACELVSSFPFPLDGEKKKFLFPSQVTLETAPFFIQYPTKIHSIPQFFTGSIVVHVRDHLRSILGIICGLGIVCGWGSFAVLHRSF